MLAKILNTTDGKFVGAVIEINSNKTGTTLPTGEALEITGRAHLGNGKWRFWNSNYILDVEETTNG
jgi:hypothetical protein